MMVHPRKSVLSAYHDCELDSAAALTVREHLLACDDCRQSYDDMASAVNAVRHLSVPVTPSNLGMSIRERIDTDIYAKVPILRGQVLSDDRRPGLVSAFAMGTALTVAALGLIFALNQVAETAAQRWETAWLPGPIAPPVMLHSPIREPRFRHSFVQRFPDVEVGKEGTVLTLASIDRNGAVRGIEIIYQDGDETTLSRALDVVRASGFEPAMLGDQTVSVNFLYLFTTTEVRST